MIRVKCPYCGRLIALTVHGRLYRHTTPSGKKCIRSGGRPS
jgi:hypothetical protein